MTYPMPYPIYSYSDCRHRLPANILFQANKLKYNVIVLYENNKKNPDFLEIICLLLVLEL